MKTFSSTSLVKIITAAMSVIMLLLSLLLGFSTWRRVNSLEAELIQRDVIPANYTEKKSALTGKPVKPSSGKKHAASRRTKPARTVVKTNDIKTPGIHSISNEKCRKKVKHRSLDDVVSDISDRMIVVDE